MAHTDVNETAVAIFRESLDAAADRLIAKRDDPKRAKKRCPACGFCGGVFKPGHLYVLIGAAFLLAITMIGTVGK
jgi:hypothetical protein